MGGSSKYIVREREREREWKDIFVMHSERMSLTLQVGCFHSEVMTVVAK